MKHLFTMLLLILIFGIIIIPKGNNKSNAKQMANVMYTDSLEKLVIVRTIAVRTHLPISINCNANHK